MDKPCLKLSAVIFVLLAVSLHKHVCSALPLADAEALTVQPEAGPEPGPDIIPGRVQNNPVLLIYDLLANLVASIPIVGVLLVEILGLGRR